MIHRDLCDPAKTKYYSPLRMQFHFLLSRYVCMDGLVPLTEKEIAQELSCDLQSVQKFIKKAVQEGIVEVIGDRLFLIKRVEDYTKGYVKHYPFLESAAFQSLHIHTQRFILYMLWAGVHTGLPFKREITTLYHTSVERTGVLNLYFRGAVYPVLKQAKTFLKLDCFEEKGKEVVRVTGLQEAFANEAALDNQGEAKWLEDMLWHHHVDELFPSAARENLLRIKKSCFNSLKSIGLELFSRALEKLLILNPYKLRDLIEQSQDEKGMGAYLRSIINDLEEKIVPFLQRQILFSQYALERTKDFVLEGTSKVIDHFTQTILRLNTAIHTIQEKKQKKKDKLEPFPFYNWLETQ